MNERVWELGKGNNKSGQIDKLLSRTCLSDCNSVSTTFSRSDGGGGGERKNQLRQKQLVDSRFFVNQANRGSQFNEGEEKEECEKTSFAKSEIRLKVSINAKKKREEKTEFSDARFKKRKARRKLQ